MVKPYRHEPLTDFTVEANIKKFRKALSFVESQLGKSYPLLIGHEEVTTSEKVISRNPSNPTQMIGTVSRANQKIAEKAMQIALETFHRWRTWDPAARAAIFFRAAAILRRRKHEFSAYLVKEAGKTWLEADADTAEAIDFLEYYARQMIELKNGKAVRSRVGEDNQYRYVPLGVGVVISPFNFPLAILVGTVTAAMVTGNTVILKPSNNTPIVAAKFLEILKEAGLPPGVLNYLPGDGHQVGEYLVDHPKTRFISFTGSKAVGCRIYERASKVHPGQIWLKRVIAEMGGKDAILFDSESDVDIAADSIVHSAFGFSGQKCSAASRVIVHEKIYEKVLEKVVQRTKQLKVGDPANLETQVGPVIDQAAYQKVMKYIEIGKQEGKLVVGGDGDYSRGYFIQPTIFSEVDESARIMQEEIFGPVVAFCKAKDFDHMLAIANHTEYGLTGSIISKNRAHIEKAKEALMVGNLYINRGCTGSVVGYQPFGGFNMSGTDSKAGGPDYLILHMQAQTITEAF